MKSILLLFLSYPAMKKGTNLIESPVEQYRFNEGDNTYVYEGRVTNDAPVKCLFDIAKRNGDVIDSILCITSELVQGRDADGNYFELEYDDYNRKGTTLNRFHCMIDSIASSLNYDEMPMVKPIQYGDTNGQSSMEIYKMMDGLIGDIQDGDEEINIYIDYTGGMRDTSFLMTVLIRYLEFRRLNCKAIVYSNNQEKVIFDITYIYEMFRIINGVNDFVKFANASTLSDFYSKTNDDVAKEVIAGIIDFSRSMSLCRIGEIDRSISRIVNGLNKPIGGNDVYSEMFNSLKSLIKEKMGFDLDEDSVRYMKLIRWCVDNGLIQQATTIFVEKMPTFYYEKKIVTGKLASIKSNETTHSGRFYTDVYGEISMDPVLGAFMKLVKKAVDGAKSKNPAPNSDDQKSKEVKALIGESLKGVKDTQIRKGIKRLQSLMDRIEQGNVSRFKYYGIKLDNKVKDPYSVCTTTANSWKLAHYLLYDDKSLYDDVPSGKENTYKRKILAMDKLESGEYGGLNDKERSCLLETMQYYFAIKVIRNRMNHASEENYTVDENRALDYLKTKNILVEDDYESIEAVILRALDSAEKFAKK